MNPVRILIADDHILIAEMWQILLAKNENYQVVQRVSDCSSLASAVTEHKPDVVLLDIALADGSSLDLLPDLKAISPFTKYLVVSAYTDLVTVKKAFSSGVHGFITKTSGLEEVNEAIATILQGKRFQCREVKDSVAGLFLGASSSRPATIQGALTIKEREIAYLVYKGLSSRQIGEKLSISPKTVEVHRHHIYQKLGLNKSTQLIWYVQNNIHLFTGLTR
ncbi:MAG TPA: response regulator transcription factor [Lacibacter sp.]|nr:response regulator transcription factor [Lacibacter sp.]HMO90149.1 response regulator transcription factor [Lacibacter sp.]HMP85842.1 response regulator transcription factor [Lacibacter sp.]